MSIPNEEKCITPNKGPIFGVRHKQLLLLWLLIFIDFCLRINLSVSIVAMTDPSASTNPDIPTYDWTNKSVILSAFFWGYIIPQLWAGWLGKKFGEKWFLVACMTIGSLAGLLTPYLAHTFGSLAVMAVRAVQGFVQGFTFPSVHGLLSKWVPPSERSRSSTFVYAAGPLGAVTSMIASGFIASSWYGWPVIFYIFSTLGLVWSLLFIILGCNGPDDHSSITREEKYFIQRAKTNSGKGNSIPWTKIFSSVPVWAIVLTHTGFNFSYWTLLIQTPIYMNKMMNFDIKSNSFLSALPYLIFWISSFAVSSSADLLVNRKILSVGLTRKIYNTIGLLIPTIALIYLGYCDTSKTSEAVALLIIAASGSVFLQCGFFVNPLDISPAHAGTIMGLSNGLSNVSGIVAPLSAQFIITDEADPFQWRTIFLISAIINVLACVIYMCFSSGKIQHWNDLEKDNKT